MGHPVSSGLLTERCRALDLRSLGRCLLTREAAPMTTATHEMARANRFHSPRVRSEYGPPICQTRHARRTAHAPAPSSRLACHRAQTNGTHVLSPCLSAQGRLRHIHDTTRHRNRDTHALHTNDTTQQMLQAPRTARQWARNIDTPHTNDTMRRALHAAPMTLHTPQSRRHRVRDTLKIRTPCSRH